MVTLEPVNDQDEGWELSQNTVAEKAAEKSGESEDSEEPVCENPEEKSTSVIDPTKEITKQELRESAADKWRKYLDEPVHHVSEVPIDVIDPLDGGVPRVRTPKVVVQADRVEKQVIVIGQGETPPKHAKCFIHLRSWIKDDPTEKTEDSRTEKEPLQVIIGKDKPHLEGVGLALMSMNAGERSLLHINWRYAYGAEGHFSFPHVPPSSDMIMDVELLGFELEENEPPRADMTFEERCRQADKRRLAGNELYKEGNLQGAEQKYTMAMSYFGESFMFQLEGLDKYKKIANDIRLPLLLNLAACKLHHKEWHQVIALCSGVLEVEESNVKALFRRGAARRELGQDDPALQDLNKAALLAPEDKAIKAEIRKVKQEKKTQAQVAKKVYDGLFKAEEQPQTWGQAVTDKLGRLAFWRQG